MNKPLPLISIIVTTFNRKNYLSETIDSILKQTYQNFELIVVDNYSNYDFLSYMKLFNDIRIRAFQNDNNGVIAVNRNFGIKKAKGDYLAFCDDDDLWIKNKLKEQLNQLIKYRVDMVCSICKSFGDVKYFSINYGIYPTPMRVNLSREGLLKNNCIAFGTTFIKKEIFDRFYGFDTREHYHGIEDYELWLRIIKSISIVFIPRIHIYYRIHSDMTQLNNPSKDEKINKLLKKYNYKLIDQKERTKPFYLLRIIYHKVLEAMIYIHIFELKLFQNKFIKY